MGFYYERFYIAKDYKKIAFLSYLVTRYIFQAVMKISHWLMKLSIIGVLLTLRSLMLAYIKIVSYWKCSRMA